MKGEAINKPLSKLLLAEDSEDDAFFFRRVLLKVVPSCQLTRVENGAAAIEFLKKGLLSPDKAGVPDLIFLDLKMPVLSGFDVLSWIQLQNLSGLLRAVVLSGSDHIEDKKKAMELGAYRYMVKPIRPPELKQLIDSLKAEPTDARSGFHQTGQRL